MKISAYQAYFSAFKAAGFGLSQLILCYSKFKLIAALLKAAIKKSLLCKCLWGGEIDLSWHYISTIIRAQLLHV